MRAIHIISRITLRLFILILTGSINVQAQYYRHESGLFFPDIKGYQTLKCDFHIHTVFSDGQVWPDYRVREAALDGLDVIAITDHIEYTPHKEYLKCDFNTSFDIAKKEGDKCGIMVIKGAEITRDMPPGHLNAIFIKDANQLNVKNVEDAVEEAYRQGAFIFWNHPCWDAQQPDTVQWFDIHTRFYEKGYIRGIEVVNDSDFCPEAWEWAMEKDLTILSNSDIHSTTETSSFTKHRPVTLVFVTEFSEASVRDALESRRTVLYYNETVYGDEDLLSRLLMSSLLINKTLDKERNAMIFAVTNISSAPLILSPQKDYPGINLHKFEIPGKSSILFYVDMGKINSEIIWFDVENYRYDINQNLKFSLSLY